MTVGWLVARSQHHRGGGIAVGVPVAIGVPAGIFVDGAVAVVVDLVAALVGSRVDVVVGVVAFGARGEPVAVGIGFFGARLAVAVGVDPVAAFVGLGVDGGVGVVAVERLGVVAIGR